jgi:IS30 family transposase
MPTGRRLSPAELSEVFKRYKAGERLSDIARSLGAWPGTVHSALQRHGGIAPPERRRAARALSLDEREEISRGLVAGDSVQRIAARLRRAPSTVSREILKNGGIDGYRAACAEKRAWTQSRRPKVCKLVKSPKLATLVATKLAEYWSPQQIQQWLREQHPNTPEMNVRTRPSTGRSSFRRAAP